jgi:hypothetical protein
MKRRILKDKNKNLVLNLQNMTLDHLGKNCKSLNRYYKYIELVKIPS